MDNRQIDISDEGREAFNLAVRLAAMSKAHTVSFRVLDNKLILYWANSPEATPLPYPMNPAQVTEFAWGWLESVKPSTRQPDHDGDNYKGFRVYNEGWGRVLGDYKAYVAIEPIWAMYGK